MSLAAHRPWRRAATTSSAVAVVDAPVVTVPYVGLVTRAFAFALDAAIINAVALLVSAALALSASIVSIPEAWKALVIAAGGTCYLLWTAGYFVAFWSTTGQTPGCRAFRIRVTTADGRRIGPRRALVRFAALLLAALPLFAGFLLILIDDRRRGLHDLLARTVVVEAPGDDRGGPTRRSPAGDGPRTWPGGDALPVVRPPRS